MQPKRISRRLTQFDYSSSALYYVTICTSKKICWFGEVVKGQFQLNPIGKIVQHEWWNLSVAYQAVHHDCYTIMPNHLHAIIGLGDVGATFMAPLSRLQQPMPDVDDLHAGKVSSVEELNLGRGDSEDERLRGQGKKEQIEGNQIERGDDVGEQIEGNQIERGAINVAPTLGMILRSFKARCSLAIRRSGYPEFRWQRNYYDHIVRDTNDLIRIRNYIRDNPENWDHDSEYCALHFNGHS